MTHLVQTYSTYAENWCVEEKAESLFGDDESFANYNKCGKKYNSKITECVKEPGSALMATCGESMSCLNAGCAGDMADALDAVDIENSLLEQSCGDLISLEDFDDGNKKDSSGWKAIGKSGLVEAHRDSNSILGNNQFLGRLSQSNPVVMKKFKVPKAVDSLKLEFSFYQVSTAQYSK